MKIKKMFLLLTMLGAVLCFCIFAANAQSDRKYNKEMEKVYKRKTKEMKKEGWKVTGASLTLEAAIMKHLRTLNSDDKNKELITEVFMCRSLNVCSAQAQNSKNKQTKQLAKPARETCGHGFKKGKI
jgi:hypothetical protein